MRRLPSRTSLLLSPCLPAHAHAAPSMATVRPLPAD